MKKTKILLSLALILTACNKRVEPKSEDEKTIYAMGLSLGRNIKRFNISDQELKYLIAGINDQVSGKEPFIKFEEYGPKIQAFTEKKMQASAEVEITASKEFLAKMALEEGAQKTGSGIVYKEVKKGNGVFPKETDEIKVHYHGTLRDGTVFDSSVQRQQPAQFPLNRVIKCWQEGMQKIDVGGKITLGCPPEMAYGERGTGAIPGGAALKFEVELLEILPPKAPEAPAKAPKKK